MKAASKTASWLFIIILLGLSLRLLFLATPNVDSDRAVNGLMARHIIKGAFPTLYYGQDYCGSIETYLVAPVFFFLDTTAFTLNFTICLESLLFILFIYFLARLITDRKTALYSALFTALSSYYLIFHSVLARSAYIEIPILGVLLFIFAHKILWGNEKKSLYFFVLGLLCGLGIWTHFLVIFYLPPIFLILFIKDHRFGIRRTFLFFLAGLVLGGLPLWVHNITHPLSTWYYLLSTSGGGEPFLTSLIDFFHHRLPEILGVMNNDTGRFTIPYFSFLIYIGYLVVLLFLFWSRRQAFLEMIQLKAARLTGMDLLLLYLFFFLLVFALSGFASGHTSRYLQPLFSVLPILFAAFVVKITPYSVPLAFLFLFLHLFANLFGTLTRVPLFSEPLMKDYRQAREHDQNLFKFLKARNINRVYCPEYWTSARLTFASREEIIFAQPYLDRYRPYTEAIDRERRVAFLFPGDNKDFEKTLENLGGHYRKSQVFGYSIYYDFSSPSYRFLELDPSQWRAVSNFAPQDATNCFDRDFSTRWTSLEPQRPGMFMQIDLGKTYADLAKVTLFSGRTDDFPRGLRLEISEDGKNWRVLYENPGYWGSLFWSGPHPFFRPLEGRIDLAFSPRSGRFLKLTQLGKDSNNYWSIAECFVYQASPLSSEKLDDLTGLLSRLKQGGLKPIYASPWVNAHLLQDQKPKIDPGDFPIGTSLFNGENIISPSESAVFVVEKDKAETLAVAVKNLFSRPYREETVGEYVIFSVPPRPGNLRPVSPRGWRINTNYNPKAATLAGDGRIETRWTSKTFQVPGMFLHIDLGKMKQLTRLRLLVGESMNDFPRGYRIRVSLDGKQWQTPAPSSPAASMYWTGENLLKYQGDLDLWFPPTSTRYLHILQTGRAEAYYWSVHEIKLYEFQIQGRIRAGY